MFTLYVSAWLPIFGLFLPLLFLFRGDFWVLLLLGVNSQSVFLCVWAHNQVVLSSVQLLIWAHIWEPLCVFVSCGFLPLQQQPRGSEPLCNWLNEATLSEFDSEFPLLSPACSDKWKFLGSLSDFSPLRTPPSILTPLPNHLLLWVKNDHGEYNGFSALDWRVEHRERVEVAVVPSGHWVNTCF